MSLSEPARSDSPPEARSELQGVEPSGNLPAPYVSPWQEFGRNLQAMAADLRLRGQELSRRNREGELSVPSFKSLSGCLEQLAIFGHCIAPGQQNYPRQS